MFSFWSVVTLTACLWLCFSSSCPQVAGVPRFRFVPSDDLPQTSSSSQSDLGQLASQGGAVPSHMEDYSSSTYPTCQLNRMRVVFNQLIILAFRTRHVREPVVSSLTWGGVWRTQRSHYTVTSCSTGYLTPPLISSAPLLHVLQTKSLRVSCFLFIYLFEIFFFSNSFLRSGSVWHHWARLPVGSHGEHVHTGSGCASGSRHRGGKRWCLPGARHW